VIFMAELITQVINGTNGTLLAKVCSFIN